MAGFHGYFLWHELMSTDPAGAKAFYPDTMKWSVAPGGIPNLDYDLWMTPDGPVGGVMQLPVEAQQMGAPTHWIPYAGTSDIDATFQLALSLGANSYVPVTNIPSVGRFAVLADPQGATFAMFQPDPVTEPDARPKIGQFSWHELFAFDAVAALAFYGQLFGWTETEAHDMGDMGIYRLFGKDAKAFGGMFNKPDTFPGPASWLCYVSVDSADDAARRVTANKGSVLHGPMEVPGGDRIAQCMDPQGGMIAVHSTANPK